MLASKLRFLSDCRIPYRSGTICANAGWATACELATRCVAVSAGVGWQLCEFISLHSYSMHKANWLSPERTRSYKLACNELLWRAKQSVEFNRTKSCPGWSCEKRVALAVHKCVCTTGSGSVCHAVSIGFFLSLEGFQKDSLAFLDWVGATLRD